MSCVIFDNCSTDDLESRINNWLSAHPDIQVKYVLQSECCDSYGARNITVSIYYLET